MKCSLPKRRWLQFSLRTMLVVMTVAGILLGGRIEYLRRCAAYHEREANRIRAEMIREVDKGAINSWKRPDGGYDVVDNKYAHARSWHSDTGKAYRQAAYLPWLPVNKPRPLQPFRPEADQEFYQRQNSPPPASAPPSGDQ